MADVFFSYAHEDRDAVRELVRLIEARELTCWWDRDIGVGADFLRSIQAELENARCVVVVWSPHSVASHWVNGEANEALERAVLVPAAIADVRVPLPFRGTETAQLHGWPEKEDRYQLRRFLDSVTAVARRDTPPTGQPGLREDIDPTLSVRVARRVADTVLRNTSGEDSSNLLRKIGLETSLTDGALALLAGADGKEVALQTMRALTRAWGATGFILWRQDAAALSEGLLAAKRPGEAGLPSDQAFQRDTPGLTDTQQTLLRMHGLAWAYIYREDDLTLLVGSSQYGPRPTATERIPALMRLLKAGFGPA